MSFILAPERLITPFGHQGLLVDLETGLVYNRARYYRPEIGRFLQRDPRNTALVLAAALLRNAQANSAVAELQAIGQYNDGLGLYQYERGNPLRASDPSGQISMLQVGARGAIGGLLFSMIHVSYSLNVVGEDLSAGQIASELALGAGFGAGVALGLGWLSNAFAAAAGCSQAVAATTITTMFSPAVFGTMLGYSVKRAQTANTYEERMNAYFDIGANGFGMLAPFFAYWGFIAKPKTPLAAAIAQAKRVIAGGRTKGMAAALDIPAGRTFVNNSKHSHGILHPRLKRLLRAVPEDLVRPSTSHCGEIGCLNEALWANESVRGGRVVAVELKAVKKAGNTDVVRSPCKACQWILDQLGVTYELAGPR